MGLEDVLERGRLREGLSCLVQIGQIWRKSISGRANCMCRALRQEGSLSGGTGGGCYGWTARDREDVGGEDAGRMVGPPCRAV